LSDSLKFSIAARNVLRSTPPGFGVLLDFVNLKRTSNGLATLSYEAKLPPSIGKSAMAHSRPYSRATIESGSISFLPL